MTKGPGSLVFVHTPFTVTVGAIFVLVVAYLGWLAWKRSGYRRWIGLLECLRVLIAVGLALTLNQPEWVQQIRLTTKPVLAILVDVSRSMQTEDVFDPANPAAEPKSRESFAKPFLNSAAWDKLRDKMDVVIESFSSAEHPSESGTDIGAALVHAMSEQGQLRAIVLVSDGDWNTGITPTQAAMQLRLRDVPVFAVPLGAESRLPDVELSSFDAPAFAVAGKPLRIPFTINSSLPVDEPAVIELKCTTGELVTKTVTIPAMSRLEDTITWKPEAVGEARLRLTVPKTGEEKDLTNNSIEMPISIRKEQLHVLIIESYPRWEYRYLRNAMQRDPGVEVNTLLFQPDLSKVGAGKGYLSAFPSTQDLAKYDVVFLGDVGTNSGQLTLDQCASLQKLVRDQASGLIFMPGLRGFESSLRDTAIADLVPIVWDDAQPRGYGTFEPGNFNLTEAGEHSLLTKLEETDEENEAVWKNLPGFQWYAPALRAKSGTEVLAVHATETNAYGRIPLIVTRTFGAGKILYMGTDGAWRWRRGVEDKYHYRFWGQVVRWMAYQRNVSEGEKMRLFYSPDQPRTGSVLTLNANVMSVMGEPLRDGVVMAQITTPSGKISSVRLLPAGEDAWGLFTGVFTPEEPGEHVVRLSNPDAGTSLDTIVTVQGSEREKVGQPAKPDVLKEIAQITKGRVLANADTSFAASAVSALPNPEVQEQRIPLWAHPVWCGLLILLLAIFWVGRKAAGVF